MLVPPPRPGLPQHFCPCPSGARASPLQGRTGHICSFLFSSSDLDTVVCSSCMLWMCTNSTGAFGQGNHTALAFCSCKACAGERNFFSRYFSILVFMEAGKAML